MCDLPNVSFSVLALRLLRYRKLTQWRVVRYALVLLAFAALGTLRYDDIQVVQGCYVRFA